MKTRKVVLIGCGNVGASFVYASLNQSLFDEYVLIDYNGDLAKGNALDYEDTFWALPLSAKSVKVGNYETFEECADADIIVIAAGVAQKPGGETRLQLVGRNIKIMADIANKVKNSGFNGITVIISNPVDIMGATYAKVTGFEPNKVIPSGTLLDSSRLRYEIAKRLKVSIASVEGFVVGEHGDSSVSLFSQVTVSSLPLAKYKKFTEAQKRTIHKDVMTKAYKIINTKKATYYGIGACVARLCKAILRDENVILPVSIKKYADSDVYIGWPAVIGKNGWYNPLKLNLLAEETRLFNKSYNAIKKIFYAAWNEEMGNE